MYKFILDNLIFSFFLHFNHLFFMQTKTKDLKRMKLNAFFIISQYIIRKNSRSSVVWAMIYFDDVHQAHWINQEIKHKQYIHPSNNNSKLNSQWRRQSWVQMNEIINSPTIASPLRETPTHRYIFTSEKLLELDECKRREFQVNAQKMLEC